MATGVSFCENRLGLEWFATNTAIAVQITVPAALTGLYLSHTAIHGNGSLTIA